MESLDNNDKEKDKRAQQIFVWEDASLKEAVKKFARKREYETNEEVTLKGSINYLIKRGLEAEGFQSVA